MKNLNFLLVFFILIFIASQSDAQNNVGIALGNSDNPARITEGDVAIFEAAALEGIRETGLCTTLERAEWKKILEERGIQKTEEFLDGSIIPQSVSLGAEYLLLLSFQNMNFTDNKKRYDDYWTRKINFDLIIGAKLVSVETGELKYNKVITISDSKSYNDSDGMYNASKGEIIQSFRTKLIGQCTRQFVIFTFDVFPPEILVIKVNESKKNKAKLVLCKTNAALRKGVKLDVFTEQRLDLGDGDIEVIKSEVGELKIVEVQSKRVVLCKVIKGGQEIMSAVGNEKLKCKPNYSGTSIFGGLLDNL